MAKSADLLGEIEAGALDTSSDLPSVLRKCIALGGATGSERLRDWAARELKGYGPDDELPSYRHMNAPMVMDAAVHGGMVTGQQIPLMLVPEDIRDTINTEEPCAQSIAEIAHLGGVAKADGFVRLQPPGASALVALLNNGLAQQGGPRQHIDRVYWTATAAPFIAILDCVRTTLVELVAEMRAGTPTGSALPPRDVAEQAVDVAIHGNKNRVTVINQVGGGNQAAGATGGATSVGAEAETPARKVMWWVAAFAAIVTAVAGVWVLFLR